MIQWYQADIGDFSGTERTSGVTIARVRLADEGEVEGGLGALVRFMAGALRPDVVQPPLSPAGWYWQGTVYARGVWTRPAGPFLTAEEAMAAADAAPWAIR